MKKVYGYIRVSTVKQGTGVSLQEQKEAIIRYAEKHGLEIVQWFEEKETAAKQGRPLFTKMMKLLRSGKSNGVIIHKIDRSARNLKDWAALGDLIDQGVDVHFAHESLDLNKRGGRLAADIQAVIASDYIRNLREEALKGLYGRLKQGIYPFNAPVGYVNQGSGKEKTIDPAQGSLVKLAFEKYSTGKYTLKSLAGEMNELGLRNTWGNRISLTSLSLILKNPFYTGVLKVKEQTFNGAHEPLISTRLYKKVQDVLKGKTHVKEYKHEFLFRKLLKCLLCGRTLSGERQKGHVYYRCHTKVCRTKTIREETVYSKFMDVASSVQLNTLESTVLHKLFVETKASWEKAQHSIYIALKLQRDNLTRKLERLTDAYIDTVLEKSIFLNRKKKLLIQLKGFNSKLEQLHGKKDIILRKAENFFELLKSLKISFCSGTFEEKRKMVDIVTSNFGLKGKELVISTKLPFTDIQNALQLLSGPLDRDRLRTCTAHYDTPATSGENYADCTRIEEVMQELLQIILAHCDDLPDYEEES